MKPFPLVKEIRSKAGALHFRRWRILQLPFFRIYVHNILKSDEDIHEHTHPWNFSSLILKGGYIESSGGNLTDARPGSILVKSYKDSHRVISLHGATWTLVFAWGYRKSWGFVTPNGLIDNASYRTSKENNALV